MFGMVPKKLWVSSYFNSLCYFCKRSSITQADKDDDYGRFELSVSNKVHNNVYAYLNGDTTFARDDKDSSVQLGLQYQF